MDVKRTSKKHSDWYEIIKFSCPTIWQITSIGSIDEIPFLTIPLLQIITKVRQIEILNYTVLSFEHKVTGGGGYILSLHVNTKSHHKFTVTPIPEAESPTKSSKDG